MFSYMLFLFFGFLGILAMLWHIFRSQDRAFRLLQEEHARIRVLLRALESRLDAVELPETASTSTADEVDTTVSKASRSATRLVPRPSSNPSEDDLLRLSFDPPATEKPAVDPALDLHFDPATVQEQPETSR
ncbi:MAG: hypothetical protein J5861_06385 [Desulfovibrio sp.]|nr:hypothetical protein [Desulfovibrio sp.]